MSNVELTTTTHPSTDDLLVLRNGELFAKVVDTDSWMGYRVDVKIGIPNFYAVFGYSRSEADAVADLWDFLN